MERPRTKRNRSAPFDSFDKTACAGEKAFDHLLVVFHRRALGDGQCNDTGAAQCETVHSQHSVRYTGQEGSILRYCVLLAHDPRGKFRNSLPKPSQLGFAALSRNVIRHEGAEWINVHPAARLDRQVKFTRADSSAGENRGELPKREIFFERYCVELMKYRRHFVIRALFTFPPRSAVARPALLVPRRRKAGYSRRFGVSGESTRSDPPVAAMQPAALLRRGGDSNFRSDRHPF